MAAATSPGVYVFAPVDVIRDLAGREVFAHDLSLLALLDHRARPRSFKPGQ